MTTLSVPSFNSLQFAKRLKEAGISEQQAEAEAEILREAFDERDRALTALENKVNTQHTLSRKESEQMATKGDVLAVKTEVLAVKTEVSADVFAVKADVLKLDAKIDLVRSDLHGEHILHRWMLGLLIAGVGAIFAKLYF